MNDIKISIVIPTKDRYKYLLPLISLLDSYNFNSTEIVIEDNSEDNSEIEHFLSHNTFTFPIIYNHSPQQLPICQNIDNAINHSNGKFVCVIGDDDAVTPLIEDFVERMEQDGIDSVRQKEELTYKWPSYSDKTGLHLGATLTYTSIGNDVLFTNCTNEVVKVIKRNILSLGNMPCVYQGIVRRAALEKLKNIGGTYFPGPSPDMANAMALSFVVEKHCLTNVPLIISGGSEFQGGKNKKIKKWVQPLENIPFISEEAKRNWDKRIPYFWCGFTVWPESGIKGLEYVGKSQLLSNINHELLLAKCLYRGPEYKKQVLSCTKNKSLVYRYWLRYSAREQLAKIKRILFDKLNIKMPNTHRVKNLNDIGECVDFLIKTYNNTKSSIPLQNSCNA